MTGSAISLAIRPRGRPIPTLADNISISPDDSTEELYKRLAAQTRLSIHRLKASKGSDGTSLDRSKDITIESTGLRDRSTIYVKDLGPQISWRTVFLVEYLGPILIHPLIYFLYFPLSSSSLIPSISTNSTSTSLPTLRQQLSLWMITLHFLKRELETLFIHRFSGPTMPAMNIFKNSFHYWILAGVNIAYFTYSPSSTASASTNSNTTTTHLTMIYLAVILYIASELANLGTHLTLRNLRPEGTNKRGIPRGWAFERVTCPNYTFEVLAWVGIAIVTASWSTILFLVVAGIQMGLWAKKKEGRYRREFGGGYRRKKYVMVPGLY